MMYNIFIAFSRNMRSRVTQLMLKVHIMLFITFLLLHSFFLIWDLEIYRNSIVNMVKLSDSVYSVILCTK